ILALDVTWTAEFAEAGWIVPFGAADSERIVEGTLPSAVNTATWEDQLFAAPLNSNVQLLWYRTDLVPEPPETWDEMIAMAEALAAEGKPHYIEVQGAQYEGLTVLFNTLIESAGGSILNEEGTEVSLGDPAVVALEAIQTHADSPASDPSWSNQQEDDNRLTSETGNSPFQLNYPFIYPSAQENAPDLAENIGWAQWPTLVEGEPSHPTIGGINLAVSSYSGYQSQAVDAITCLRNEQNQIRNAVDGGLPPTIEALYADREFIDGGYPFAAEIYAALQNASVRPKTPAYQSVSLMISYTLSPPRSVSASTLDPLSTAISDALT
nr:ABC transporter substrate-binding protein [Micromonospora sp. DSM 115978]